MAQGVDLRQLLRGVQVDAVVEDYRNSVSLWFYQDKDGEMFRLDNLGPDGKFERDNGTVGEPTLRVTGRLGFALMDALWKAGIRPRSGEDRSAEVAAMKAPLEDMRTLVFKHGPAA